MVPSDRRFNNLVVDRTLAVKGSIATPFIQVGDLVVTGSTSIPEITMTELKTANLDASNIVAISTSTTNLTAANATLTDATITNLTATNASITTLTISNLTISDLAVSNLTVVNLLASDIKTNTFSATSFTVTTFSTSNLTLTDIVNQIVLGTGNTITLNAPTPAASRVYTTPDVGLDASFVMTEGAQTINGIKTFSDTVVFLSGFSLASLTLTDVTNQLTMGTGNTVTLNAPTPGANRTYTLDDIGTNASFVMNNGVQSINGAKTFLTSTTFNGEIINSLGNSQFLLTFGGTSVTLNVAAPAANRVYTMTDVLSNANFIMSEGTQTINGLKTFSSAITDSAATNQLVLGGVTNITINAPAPAASRVYTLPDVLANANFILSEGVQTINGLKTFSATTTFGTSILLPTSGGTPTGLDYYEEYTASVNFVGPQGATTIAATINIVRVGKSVTMNVSDILFPAATVASPITSTNAIPSQFQPTIGGTGFSVAGVAATGLSNTAIVNVVVSLQVSGANTSIVLYNGTFLGNFAASGQDAASAFAYSWTHT